MPTYSAVSNIRIAPIQHIKLYYSAAPDSPLFAIYNLEKGSTFSIAPVEVDNDRGGKTIVAWELAITAIMAENDYETKIELFTAIGLYPLSDVDLRLKPLDGQVNGSEVNISCDGGSVGVIAYTASVNIEYVEDRGPRGVIRVGGLWSVDAFSAANFGSLYQQVSGF